MLAQLLVILACLVSSNVHAFRIAILVRPGIRTRVRSSLTTALAAPSSTTTTKTEEVNHVVLEYCTECKWMARTIWMSQELLTTFNDDNLSAISLVPSRTHTPEGRFVVTHYDGTKSTVLWDRQEKEGFPAMKDMKQLVRDKIDPEKFLGHSDNKQEREGLHGSSSEEPSTEAAPVVFHVAQALTDVPEPNISIKYCTGCRWMLRSTYFATELLTTFDKEINSITLIPSRPPEQGGIFVREIVFELDMYKRLFAMLFYGMLTILPVACTDGFTEWRNDLGSQRERWFSRTRTTRTDHSTPTDFFEVQRT